MESLDPRINRLGLIYTDQELQKEELDQLETFQVFVQPKEGKPYQHEGIVHAPNEDIAFLFGKEQFSRRYTCSGIWIAKTRNVYTTELTEGGENIYGKISIEPESESEKQPFEIFHLYKRGKQHRHVGRVEASGINNALLSARDKFNDGKPVLNVWVIKSNDIFYSKETDRDIWSTLPEKQFRDAIDYRGADKIKKFKEENESN